jgi:hypothetical protein
MVLGWSCALSSACGKLIGIDPIMLVPADAGDSDANPAPADATPEASPDAMAEASPDATVDAPLDVPEDGDATGPEAASCNPATTFSDNHNCGRCGRDCLGADCTKGQCQPILLATGLSEPLGIVASSDGYVYWVDGYDGSVSRVRKDSPGSPQLLYQGNAGATDLVVDDQYVYYTVDAPFPSQSEGGARRIPKTGVADAGTDLVILSTGYPNAEGIAADAANIYYVGGYNPTGLFRASKSTPGTRQIYLAYPTDAASEGPFLQAVAIDDQYAYTTDSGSNLVLRISLDAAASDPPTIFARTFRRPSAIRVDGDFVYWGDGVNLYRQARADVMGVPRILVAYPTQSIAVDVSDLYFVSNDTFNGGSKGDVIRISKDGTSFPAPISSGWSSVANVAIDERAVYFTTAHEVVMIAK